MMDHRSQSARVRRGAYALALACTLLSFLPGAALGGSPLLCHPVEVSGAATLPGGDGAYGISRTYDRRTLVADVLALLTPDMPVLVRMETLRRATLYAINGSPHSGEWKYAAGNRTLAQELLTRLEQRIEQQPNALAWFDAGYLRQCYREAGLVQGNAGYNSVLHAIELSSGSAEMEFAAALMTVWSAPKARHSEHLQKARAGARPGSLLARNLQLHFKTT